MSKVYYIKGNPKYSINDKITNKFNTTISDTIVEVYGKLPIILESGVRHDEVGSAIKNGDIVIGHSRGASYAGIWKKYYHSKGLFIAIGAPDYVENDILITHDDDKTIDDDFSGKSLKAHWTMSDEMIDTLTDALTKYKNTLPKKRSSLDWK